MRANNILISIIRGLFIVPQKRNVGSVERIASAAAGATLTAMALRNIRHTPHRLIPGAYLLWRGASGYCPLYNAIEADTTEGAEAFEFSRSFTILRDRKDLYNYWHDFNNLPGIMEHVTQVAPLTANKYLWQAQFNGQKFEWQAEITEDEEYKKISWESVDDYDVRNSGSVIFSDAPKGGTEIKVQVKYFPAKTKLGRLVAKALNPAFKQMLREDLRNLKRKMETNEIVVN
ncbi:MAG: DUF2892 domain-containing protein [Cyclobacteriaceae bacterium]|nr:DUF2892 domain-containing protein [Cyclobacteriaceae bacterium]